MLSEYTTPGQSAAVRDNESLYNLLTERIKRTGKDTTIAAYKGAGGSWQNITSGEFHTRVLQAAKGLIALGVEAHQSVALFSATHYKWAVLDFALAAIGAVRADDVATIVYTSGSTGVPKGVELTHRNFMSITRGASAALHEIIADGYPRLLLFLPLAHCFARVCSCN